MAEENNNVGEVTLSRYEQIVAELRDVVEQQTRGQFTIGDRALEIEPMRPRGGPVSENAWSVEVSLTMLAEDIRPQVVNVKAAAGPARAGQAAPAPPRISFQCRGCWPASTANRAAARDRATARRQEALRPWTTPKRGSASSRRGFRQEKVTAIHSLAQETEVAAAVTTDFLKRPQVAAKVSQNDKVRVVEEFTRDEHVATTAATNLLRRPDVAFKAMSDDTARFQVNHAQNERSRQAHDHFERTKPVAPAVRNIDRTVEFLDLVTACHAFVAAAGRTVPGLRDRTLSEDESTIVHQNVAKVRATLDWIETAVDTGKVDMDDELAGHAAGRDRRGPRLPAQGRRRQTPCRHRPLRPVRGPPGRAGVPPAGAGRRTVPAVGSAPGGAALTARPRREGVASIWTRADGYQLGAERAALEAYERQVVGEKLAQFRRFITGTVAPHAAAHPTDKWVRHIVAQLNSIESTLDLIASA
ncbi:hypothetical protein SCYAM73S_06863 [Streptomyces cyaneofuscatus]